MELANRVQQLTQSPTIAISSKAKELKDAGYDVISLGFGEPDFNTPEYIIRAAKNAMDQGCTKYTPSGGVAELKEAIADQLYEDQQLAYNLDEIIVTTGAKYALYALFQVLLNEGDEVIIPTPYWVSYPDQIMLAGGNPVFMTGLEENDYKITSSQLEEAITAKTKAIIINSPSNPTGMMYTEEELAAIGAVCLKHNILIVSDEIYEKLIYTSNKHISIASLSKQLKERTVIINGVSKSHAMTGWRIGYAAGPAKLIKAMTNLASHATSNPTSIAQYAAIEAYTNQAENKRVIAEMREVFSGRLNRLYQLLIEIPGVNCVKPEGAFYLFPNVLEAAKLTNFSSVDEWCVALLEEEKLALVPGSGFGAPNNVRLSYAASMDVLEEAAARMKSFVLKNKN